MKYFWFLTFLFTGIFFADAQVNENIKPYVDFLQKEKRPTAKEYIISQFEDNDIVILCERDHRDITQYDLIMDVISDPYFVENVGVVFTEVGAQQLDQELNALLQNGSLSREMTERRILNLQRDAMFPLWEKTSFSRMLRDIHDLNRKLPAGKKIIMHPTDVFFIEGEPTLEKLNDMILKMSVRDSLMACRIITSFDEARKENPCSKALVIMNYRHAYNQPVYADNNIIHNTGEFLFRQYPDRVANIFINSYANSKTFSAIHDGKWDASFAYAKMEDTGFNFKNSPFGKDALDHWGYPSDLIYQQIFTGMVYYLPIAKFDMAKGVPHLMENGFYDEYVVRNRIYMEAIYQLRGIHYPGNEAVDAPKERVMEFNKTVVTKFHNLDAVNVSIEKWLK